MNPGDAGAFGDLGGIVGDGLTPHYMPQDALNFLPRNKGGALVMPHAEHIQTRTYGPRGRVTKAADAGRPFEDVFKDDIADVRRIAGNKYDAGLQKLIEYYKKKGMLPKGALKINYFCP